MKLLSNAQFDIRNYYGTLVIVYPEGEGEWLVPLQEKLAMAGYDYRIHAIGPCLSMLNDDGKDLSDEFERCACFLPIITDTFLTEKFKPYYAMLWHFIGLMAMKAPGATVPFIPVGAKISLAGSPIQGLDVLNSIDEVMHTVSAKFAPKLICNNYYEDRVTNLYAARRIIYHRLCLRFHIYEEAFQNAKRMQREYTGHRISDDGMDDAIREQVLCGCRVVSFGRLDNLPPQMQAYRDEISPRISDYANELAGKRSYRLFSEDERMTKGIRAVLETEIMIPVHKLLGAYIKCYLTSVSHNLPTAVLLTLFEPDLCEDHKASEYDPDRMDDLSFWEKRYPIGTHIDNGGSRFFFELNELKRPEDSNEHSIPEERFGVGNRMDYIYPQ